MVAAPAFVEGDRADRYQRYVCIILSESGDESLRVNSKKENNKKNTKTIYDS